jgi:hypothetical protein
VFQALRVLAVVALAGCSIAGPPRRARRSDRVARRIDVQSIARLRLVHNTDPEVTVTDEDMKTELERLRQENERLKNRQTRGVSLKVSEKGGVSVYGLGRFPVTLYKEQWARLLDMADDIRTFMKENDAKLKAKAE